MPSLIIPGDIVKYRGVACYTGKSHTLHALAFYVEHSHVQAPPLHFSSSDPTLSKESGGCLVFFLFKRRLRPFPSYLPHNVENNNHQHPNPYPAQTAVNRTPELSKKESNR